MPLESAAYGVPGITYACFRRDETSIPTGTYACTLKFTIKDGPGPPGAVKRSSRFPMKIHFVWGFCVGAHGT